MIYVHHKKHHIGVMVAAALVVSGSVVGYNYFSVSKARAQNADANPLSSDATTAAPTDSPLSPAQAALLDKIKSIKLDDSIFKDPSFLSFVDYGIDIGRGDPGKANPFAPISGTSVKAPAKTTKK